MKTYKELQEELNETIIPIPRDHRGLGFPWDKPLRPHCPHPDCPHERGLDPYRPFKPHFRDWRKYTNDSVMKESWEEHKKIFQNSYSFLDDNQKRKVKGPYDLNILKKMHSDAVNRITQKFPNYSWTHDKIRSYSPSEEGYGTHYITSQTEDDETGHNFLVSSYYDDGHHISSICYGS